MSPYYAKLRAHIGTELLLMPSVAAIISDSNGRLLLIEKHDGSWSLPAGAIEPGETPESAVIREVEEETGGKCIPVKLLGLFGGGHFRHVYPNGDQVEYVVAVYACTVNEWSAPRDDEASAMRFFSEDEMPQLALPYPRNMLFPTA